MSLYREILPEGWGDLLVTEPKEIYPGYPGARSYDHTGNRLNWLPGPVVEQADRIACDFEDRSRPVEKALASLVPEREDFYVFWTRAEVCAKLLDIPIVAFLRDPKKAEGKIELKTLHLGESRWTVTIGLLRGAGATA